ncbi:MAG: methyltransferase domain-containing protein [Myxococcota bacterium]
MRVADLDRDMPDVLPTGSSPDAEYVFQRMESATLDALRAGPGRRILDSAGGLGQDSRSLARRGAWVVCAEPSRRMSELGRWIEAEEASPGAEREPVRIAWTRSWSETLPFRNGAFDGAFCKGALDHFDDPERCIRELARVTTPHGRVVLAVANFESLGCRLQRLLDRWLPGSIGAGRRPYHVPSDHFTRYDPALLREQVGRHVLIDECRGISLLWGLQPWSALLAKLRGATAQRLLRLVDRIAAWLPAHSDVILIAGRPRQRP